MLARRSFLAALAGSALIASGVRAQQAPPAQPVRRRIALASATLAGEAIAETGGDPSWAAFFAELKAQGFDAQGVAFEKYSGSQYNFTRRVQGNRLNALGVAIARTKPDLIVATNSYIARGAAEEASTTPVVFVVGDARGAGLVETLDRPGANLTGVTAVSGQDWEAARIELLREAVPAARNVAYLIKNQSVSPTRTNLAMIASARGGAERLGLTFQPAYYADLADDVGLDTTSYLRAILDAQRSGAQAMAVADMLDFTEYGGPLGGWAMVAKLPAIAPWREFVIGGGLMSYGPNQVGMFRTAAGQVARILKGEKPGDIAVARPEAELVVSQRNAGHVGVTLPQSLIAKAKEVLR